MPALTGDRCFPPDLQEHDLPAMSDANRLSIGRSVENDVKRVKL